ncbi:MAG: hypothetical protein ACRC33_23230 [Gemmataceae bacterium]
MKAKVKLGCLRDIEALPTPFHVGSGHRRWMETYQTTRLDLPLPAEGTADSPMECPLCARRLTIKLASPARVIVMVQWGLLAWAVLCLGIAALTFFFPPASDKSNMFAYLTAGFGAVGLLALGGAAFCEQLPVSLFKGDLVTISADEVREQAQITPAGHKILEIDLA